MKITTDNYFNLSFFFATTVAASLVYVLSDTKILAAIIFFGQGHFLLSYVYANISGKINTSFFKVFVPLTLILGVLCFLFQDNYLFYSILLFISSVLFTAHYCNDEFKIAGFGGLQNKLLLVMPVVLSFSAVFISRLFHVDKLVSSAIALPSFIFFFIFIKYYKKDPVQKLSKGFLFFYISNLFIPLIVLWYENISASQVLGFIIFFHYSRWYFFYFRKFEGKALTVYLDMVIWVNVLIFLTFFEYLLAPRSGILYLFYSPLFFYAWTIIHILVFLRKSDYTLTV